MLDRQPHIGFTAQDSTGSYGLLRFTFRHGVDRASAYATATSMRGLIGAVSGATLVRQSIVYSATETAPFSVDSSADVVQCGVLIFSCETEGEYAIVPIPGILPEMLMQTGPGAGILIDIQQPAIAAILAELTNGTHTNQWGYLITSFETGFLQLRP